jgi:hypothetical protein
VPNVGVSAERLNDFYSHWIASKEAIRTRSDWAEIGRGWAVSTSDNALIYLRQLDGTGYVAIEYGRMVSRIVTGLRVDGEHNRIHEPHEVHTCRAFPSVKAFIPTMGGRRARVRSFGG